MDHADRPVHRGHLATVTHHQLRPAARPARVPRHEPSPAHRKDRAHPAPHLGSRRHRVNHRRHRDAGRIAGRAPGHQARDQASAAGIAPWRNRLWRRRTHPTVDRTRRTGHDHRLRHQQPHRAGRTAEVHPLPTPADRGHPRCRRPRRRRHHRTHRDPTRHGASGQGRCRLASASPHRRAGRGRVCPVLLGRSHFGQPGASQLRRGQRRPRCAGPPPTPSPTTDHQPGLGLLAHPLRNDRPPADSRSGPGDPHEFDPDQHRTRSGAVRCRVDPPPPESSSDSA
ncbi:hypothetical protein MSIMFB_03233 [Mycobacterium simulans]|uniref:Uncharacterized protein n=1 Tax=Mycobacterium simulans TaxID=627089 RepID=A0A7Z7NAE4_9MYCO|nr:hypothetical protein MSIMFB_03233 [Mycobacterium simulans]